MAEGPLVGRCSGVRRVWSLHSWHILALPHTAKKIKKSRLGPRWQGMAMLPSQTVPTSAHRKAEKRTKGGRKEGAIIWGGGGEQMGQIG